MRSLKKMVYVGSGILLALLLILVVLSLISRKAPEREMDRARLRPCPEAPNCVCSEYPGTSFVEPLHFIGPPQGAWKRAKEVIREMGGRIEIEREGYLWAVFFTRIFRFRDDVELRMDYDEARIHIRSASRVGYSDLGQNRKRVERLRARFNQEQG